MKRTNDLTKHFYDAARKSGAPAQRALGWARLMALWTRASQYSSFRDREIKKPSLTRYVAGDDMNYVRNVCRYVLDQCEAYDFSDQV